MSWTVLISGYAQYGHGEEALNYFGQMQGKGSFSEQSDLSFNIEGVCDLVGAFGQEGQRITR